MSQDIRPTFHSIIIMEQKKQPKVIKDHYPSEFSENLILFSAQHTERFFSARALCDKRQEVALMG